MSGQISGHKTTKNNSGIVFYNAKDPSETINLWFNTCAGCYSRGVTPVEGVTPDSPLLGRQKGETYDWLDRASR